MTRYILLVHVRPEGSEGQFDPCMLTVQAVDDKTALDVGRAVAAERGWDSGIVNIVRREKLLP